MPSASHTGSPAVLEPALHESAHRGQPQPEPTEPEQPFPASTRTQSARSKPALREPVPPCGLAHALDPNAPAVSTTPTSTTPGSSRWLATTIRGRTAVIRALRQRIAAEPGTLLDAFSPDLARTRADSLVAEVLPLLEACRFLERSAARILAPRRLGRSGRPLWLAGVQSTVERVPLGRILVVAPSNYPLFLPSVQVLQALVAGNTVVWKPGRGGEPVARAVAALLVEAGLPEGVLRVTGEGVDEVRRELAADDRDKPAKVIFTGSAEAGRAVAHFAAEAGIPLVAELSGADAVIALPSADQARLADALCFGMRLNGSATCMAPRRLLLEEGGLRRDGSRGGREPAHDALIDTLRRRFAEIPGIPVAPAAREQLLALLTEAESAGATVLGDPHADLLRPLLVLDATPAMHLTQTDLFVPILSVMRLRPEQIFEAQEVCPFALTVSVWGGHGVELLASRLLSAGTVLINDLIVPTADPRVPFGGRRGSGFGVTRGAEGLLEMTAARTVQVRRNKSTRHFAPTTAAHEPFFASLVELLHGRGLGSRFAALRRLVTAARKLG